jgi:2-oxoglutarate ferredoxin oxidoreductase subunit alpha
VHQAVRDCLRSGLDVAHIHLRYLNPLPKNLSSLLGQFDEILVPELNTGQLATLLRDKLLVRPCQLNKVTGQPFTVAEIKRAISEHARPRMQEVRP